MLNLSFFVTISIWYNQSFIHINGNQLLLLSIFNGSWLVAANLLGLYQSTRTIRMDKIIYNLFRSSVLFYLLITAISFVTKQYYSRLLLSSLAIVTMVCVSVSQVIAFMLVKYFRSKGRNTRSMIILGHGELSIYLRMKILSRTEFGYRFSGYFDDYAGGKNVLGKIDDVIPFLQENDVAEIYCYPAYLDSQKLEKIIEYADDHFIKVKIIPDYQGFQHSNMSIEMMDDIPVLCLHPMPLEDFVNVVWKRLFDLAFSAFAFLFVFWWLFPIVAVAIKINSRGPVFFKQLRGGRGNTPFMIYKFRTMYVHQDQDIKQACKNDKRITRVGRLLRKTSIDELPQLINVFMGQMSIIGPRPHALKHNTEFRISIREFNERHVVKPGITGLAQVKGYRGEISNRKDLFNRLKMDIFYVRNWSFWLDLKILFLTIGVLLHGQDSAY